MTRDNYYNCLKHYGIPGMQKGVNRWRNPDGTLTEEGKRHYGIGLNSPYSSAVNNRIVEINSRTPEPAQNQTQPTNVMVPASQYNEFMRNNPGYAPVNPELVRKMGLDTERKMLDMYGKMDAKEFARQQKAKQEATKRVIKVMIAAGAVGILGAKMLRKDRDAHNAVVSKQNIKEAKALANINLRQRIGEAKALSKIKSGSTGAKAVSAFAPGTITKYATMDLKKYR